MKLNEAYIHLEARRAASTDNSEKSLCQQLLIALDDLKGRDLSPAERTTIEEALGRLRPDRTGESNLQEFRRRAKAFLKEVRTTLSLIEEDYYMGLGLGFGVAAGGLLGSLLQGVAGIPEGTSGTGVGIGFGLVIGFLVAHYLEIEARKQNRILVTRKR
jgi:hypothetical protein